MITVRVSLDDDCPILLGYVLGSPTSLTDAAPKLDLTPLAVAKARNWVSLVHLAVPVAELAAVAVGPAELEQPSAGLALASSLAACTAASASASAALGRLPCRVCHRASRRC